MQEIIQEPLEQKKKINIKGLFNKASGRFGISWQIGNKEFFVGVSMQTVEIDRVVKIKTSNFKLHSGSGRVLDL